MSSTPQWAQISMIARKEQDGALVITLQPGSDRNQWARDQLVQAAQSSAGKLPVWTPSHSRPPFF